MVDWSLDGIPRKYLLGIVSIMVVLIGVGVVLGLGGTDFGEKTVFFENEYVKFQIPSQCNVTDNSDNIFLSLVIYQSGVRIGGLAGFYYSDDDMIFPEASYGALTKNAKEIQVSNKKGYEGTLSRGDSSYIFVPTSPKHSIMLIMYPGHENVLNIIKNSLVIKKEPPKANSLLLLSWS